MEKVTLAIDGSTSRTGWAFRANGKVHHGVIIPPKKYKGDVMYRSRWIANEVATLVDCYDVVNLVIERPIKKGSIDSTIKLSLFDGMVIGAVRHGYTLTPLPSEWRSWYGLKTKATGRAVRDDWKNGAIKEVQDLGYEIHYDVINKGKSNERIEYSDDEAEAILILLASEKKGL